MATSRRVYLVRHGETESNRAGIVQGHDDPLSEVGLAQAQAIAERIQRIPFAHLLSSDMPRARVTAEHIARSTGKTVQESPLLREVVSDPHMVGRPFTDFSDSWWVPPATLDEHRPPWGDSMTGVLERARGALELLRSFDSDVVAVTHGAFLSITVAAAVWEHPSVDTVWGVYRKFLRTNSGLTILSYGDYESAEWRLLTWNDQAHVG